MWWKLGGLFLLTATLCVSVIPIRTHAVMYDPSNPPAPWTLRSMLANMYLTPTAGLLIAAIVGVAAFVASRCFAGSGNVRDGSKADIRKQLSYTLYSVP
jgi:hypothetical protein